MATSNIARLATAVLLGCVMASGQSLPNAPSTAKQLAEPLKQPDFWAATGFHVVSVAVDLHYEHVNCEEKHLCFEGNPGANHWAHRVPEIVLFAGASYGCRLMLREHKWWRTAVCNLPQVGWGLYNIVDGTKIHYLRADEEPTK